MMVDQPINDLNNVVSYNANQDVYDPLLTDANIDPNILSYIQKLQKRNADLERRITQSQQKPRNQGPFSD